MVTDKLYGYFKIYHTIKNKSMYIENLILIVRKFGGSLFMNIFIEHEVQNARIVFENKTDWLFKME